MARGVVLQLIISFAAQDADKNFLPNLLRYDGQVEQAEALVDSFLLHVRAREDDFQCAGIGEAENGCTAGRPF